MRVMTHSLRPAAPRRVPSTPKYAHYMQKPQQQCKGLLFYSSDKVHRDGESVNHSLRNSEAHDISGKHSPQSTAYTPPRISPDCQYLFKQLANARTEQEAIIAVAAILNTVELEKKDDKYKESNYKVSAHTSSHKPS